jgi:hypothetical protein
MMDCSYCYSSDAPWAVVDHEKGCMWSDPDFGNTAPVEKAGAKSSAQTFTFAARTCTHALDTYYLSDGTAIYLSGSADRYARTWEPDLAFYLDGSWTPRTVAFHIGWQDYGLPYVSDAQLLSMARLALSEARQGKTVEIGCIGSHGRTGTFVAILDCLSMDYALPAVAISNVRGQHCWKAVETAEQEWFVRKCAALMNGTDVPTQPRKARKTVTKTKKGKTK